MSRLDNLKEKLAARQNVLSINIGSVAWSGMMQTLSKFPLDFIMFDLEHGILTAEGIEDSLRVCRMLDVTTVVRIQDCVPHLISKTLDMGADGILIPRVESLEQVATAVRCARYYPRGRKGCGGFSNLRPEDKGNLDRYNDNRLIFIQMESKEGLAVLPQILETYGKELAGVIIGPYDASIMVGTPLDILSDAMTDFIRQVFDICHQYGISCGSYVDGPSLIPRYRDLGANIFWTGGEIGFMCMGIQQLLVGIL